MNNFKAFLLRHKPPAAVCVVGSVLVLPVGIALGLNIVMGLVLGIGFIAEYLNISDATGSWIKWIVQVIVLVLAGGTLCSVWFAVALASHDACKRFWNR